MKAMPNEDIEKLLAQHSATPRLQASTGHFFQPIVIYNRKVDVYDRPLKHHKESVPFIFYSEMVFLSAIEAANYLPIYVKRLIDTKDLPEDVLNADRTLNEEFIKTAVIKLQLGQEIRES